MKAKPYIGITGPVDLHETRKICVEFSEAGSEMDTLGPSAKDVAGIKADQGQNELIEVLSESYGGSFDVELELKESGEEDTSVIKKYFQINPDVAVRFTDEIEDKPDFSIEIDYNVLYDFVNYMSYEIEGDKIKGPRWVLVDGDTGPGKFFSILGAVSKMWREGINIKPRYSLLKILFSDTKKNGLSKLYLYWNLNLVAVKHDFASSGSNGGVVLVNGNQQPSNPRRLNNNRTIC